MEQLTSPVRVDSREALMDIVAERDRVLVEFYTEGCGICQSIEPVLGIVARETDAAVVMVNPRDSPELIEEFTIRSVPTLVLFEDGEPVDRLADGFQGADAVLSFVNG